MNQDERGRSGFQPVYLTRQAGSLSYLLPAVLVLVVVSIGSTASGQVPGNLLPPRQSQTQPRQPQPPIGSPFGQDRPRQSGIAGDGFDEQDPTQVAPDMRRILEGEQEQVRRDPPPAIEVVGKVIGSRGNARALLRINGRFYLIEKGSRFSLPTNLEPILYTVVGIDSKGVEIQGGEHKRSQRLP